jgi:cytochrome P450
MAAIPVPDAHAGLMALGAMLFERSPLAALRVFHAELGDIFRINLPHFTPVVMVGPQAAHFVLVEERRALRWRNEIDPVTQLLRHGLLVEDGRTHDELRKMLSPALHKQMLSGYAQQMWQAADQVMSQWPEHGTVDMLVEMRKIALLTLMRSLYQVDMSAELHALWDAVLGSIAFISPGLWMLWRGMPRPQYRHALQQMDAYLYRIIAERRKQMEANGIITGSQQAGDTPPADLLGLLILSDMSDDLIRDQMLTMLIAGHDTVTALMAWTFYLLGRHPEILADVQQEVRSQMDGETPPSLELINEFSLLEAAIRESLRLYPPIHLGSRLAAVDLEYGDYVIPRGERVIYSIYLTQRHPDYWPSPQVFDPSRHLGASPLPYSWLAFGGGPRNCIGTAFGQVEARIVLATVLARYDLLLEKGRVTPHMGATLEPRPGVKMRVTPRK